MDDSQEDMIDIYHTSPEEINKIDKNGRFGSNLFFSNKPYFMTQSENPITYKKKINKNKLIKASDFSYQDYDKLKPYIEKIMQQTGLNEEDALDLLSEKFDIHGHLNKLQDTLEFNQFLDNEDRGSMLDSFNKLNKKDLGEYSWDLQHMAAELAKSLGYEGVELEDEQGIAYLIDMLGKEGLLEKHE